MESENDSNIDTGVNQNDQNISQERIKILQSAYPTPQVRATQEAANTGCQAKPNKAKSSIFTITIIGIIVLGFSCYGYLKLNQYEKISNTIKSSQNTALSNEKINKEECINIDNGIISASDGWLKTSKDDYFSFKYPNNLVINSTYSQDKTGKYSSLKITMGKTSLESDGYDNINKKYPSYINVWISKNLFTNTDKEIYKDSILNSLDGPIQSKYTQINNSKVDFYTYVLRKNDIEYTFSLSNMVGSENVMSPEQFKSLVESISFNKT